MVTGKLPNGFKWKTWSDKCDVEARRRETEEPEELDFVDETDQNWRPDKALEVRFSQVHSEWMAASGTPIKRTPSVGWKDLDLFKLFSLVQQEGGFAKVPSK